MFSEEIRKISLFYAKLYFFSSYLLLLSKIPHALKIGIAQQYLYFFFFRPANKGGANRTHNKKLKVTDSPRGERWGNGLF